MFFRLSRTHKSLIFPCQSLLAIALLLAQTWAHADQIPPEPSNLFSTASSNSRSMNESHGSVENHRFPLEGQAATEALSQVNKFDSGAIRPLFNWARELLEAGSPTAANEVLEHVFQASRLRDGLYSEFQVPVLELQIESLTAMEDWDRVDRKNRYLAHLVQRIYGMEDPRLDRSLLQVVTWHVNAVEFDLDNDAVGHLQAAREILTTRLKIAELTLDEDHPRFGYLRTSIGLAERELYLRSGAHRERIREAQRARRDAMLADLDF